MHTQGAWRLKGYAAYWWPRLPVRTFLEMSKWHKYFIPFLKFELDLWGNIHHINIRSLIIRHLGKTTHLGSLYSKKGRNRNIQRAIQWVWSQNRQEGGSTTCSVLCEMEVCLVTAWPHWIVLLIYVSLPDCKRTPNDKLLKCLTFPWVKLNEMNPPSLSFSVLKYFAIKETEAAILEKRFQEILRKILRLVVLKTKWE